jgi:hypothetical protein
MNLFKKITLLLLLSLAAFGQLVTTAQPPAQPAVADYSTSALQTYPLYSRASYQAATGLQPPNYDPTQPTKAWAATDATTFGWYPPQGLEIPAWTPFTLTAAQAAAVNIPGIQTFPAYVIAPTAATWTGGGFQALPVDPGLLSTQAQAIPLAASWGLPASSVSQQTVEDGQTFTANGETRAVWVIAFGTVPPLEVNVGMMLQGEYAAGVGAPGSWTGITAPIAGGTNPVWVSTQPASAPAANAAGPIPMRQLNTDGATGESFVATLMAVEIVDSNVPSAATQASGSGGGLTPAQAAQLQQAVDGINTLLATFGKPAAQ